MLTEKQKEKMRVRWEIAIKTMCWLAEGNEIKKLPPTTANTHSIWDAKRVDYSINKIDVDFLYQD